MHVNIIIRNTNLAPISKQQRRLHNLTEDAMEEVERQEEFKVDGRQDHQWQRQFTVAPGAVSITTSARNRTGPDV